MELRLAKMGHMECSSMYRKSIPADTTYSHMEPVPEWHRLVPSMACMTFLALIAFGMALVVALLP